MRICKTAIVIAVLSGGCLSTVPQELLDARAAYQHAGQSAAAELAPAELHKAREVLAQAEQAFADEPDAQRTRDLAYVAQRKAQLAEALGNEEKESRRKAQAEREAQTRAAQIEEQTRGELARTRNQVAQLGGQLNVERQARVDAEANALTAEHKSKELLEALSKLSAVKEEERGLVITLSGSVLFAFNQAVLYPEAQTRLNQVAEALLSVPERSIVVEGYTDSRGSGSYNVDLSQRRADAVRSYLVSRGISADRIRAQGFGKSRPVADNGTAEGRANNRRVEIVVEHQQL
jgi:outer membrane protein OmpA-like peptidoglycan-associated protein